MDGERRRLARSLQRPRPGFARGSRGSGDPLVDLAGSPHTNPDSNPNPDRDPQSHPDASCVTNAQTNPPPDHDTRGRAMKQVGFHLVSLGCAKNTVDSESMAGLLRQAGFEAILLPEEADILIVNTCGFIAPAREESFRVLRELAEAKRPGQLLIAAGCMTQRYGSEVIDRVPGIDGLLGTRRWMDIVHVVRKLRRGPHPLPVYHLPDTPTVGQDEGDLPRVAIQGHSAYLKIADGCRRPCAFCAIPLIKGTAVSRPPETILDEARRLRTPGGGRGVLSA